MEEVWTEAEGGVTPIITRYPPQCDDSHSELLYTGAQRLYGIHTCLHKTQKEGQTSRKLPVVCISTWNSSQNSV